MITTVSRRLLRVIAAYLLASLVTGYMVYASLFFDDSGMGKDAQNDLMRLQRAVVSESIMNPAAA